MPTATNTQDHAELVAPARSHMWRIGDVAAYLTVSDNTARDLLRTPGALPHPIAEVGRVRLWWPNQFDAWAAAAAGLNAPSPPSMAQAPPAAQLWRFSDVASFLTLCENSARGFLDGTDDVPTPLISSDRLRLWHPCQWATWAARRAGLIVDAVVDVDAEMRFFS